jgi:hypothetical protein
MPTSAEPEFFPLAPKPKKQYPSAETDDDILEEIVQSIPPAELEWMRTRDQADRATLQRMAGRQAMTLELPRQRSLNGLIKKANRDAARRGCLPHGSRLIYAGLLHHAREQGWKDGAASHLFKKLYGTWPRNQDRGPPIEPPDTMREWISLLPKKSKK